MTTDEQPVTSYQERPNPASAHQAAWEWDETL